LNSVFLEASTQIFQAVELEHIFHPLRVGMVGMLLTSITFFANFFLVHDQSSFTFWLIVNFVAQAVYLGAYLAILPRLLPRVKYGQFFTANQIFGFAGVALAPVLSGWLLETLKDYRFIYVWCGACTLAGFIMCALLYRNWLRLGGDKSYQPPGFENGEAVPATTGH
jgi:MFS family permease